MPYYFTHPMSVITPSRLKELTIAIEQLPASIAYCQLLSRAHKALKFTPSPADRMCWGSADVDPREVLQASADAAYTLALAWRLSEVEHYAAKAAAILMSWAHRHTLFHHDRIDSIHDTVAARDLGGWFTPMLYAADLLFNYHGWAMSERYDFETFWRTRVLIHTHGFLMHTSPEGGGNHWRDAAIKDVLAAGIVFEDEGLCDAAIGWLVRIFNDERKLAIGFDAHGARYTYLPTEVSRYDGRSGIIGTAEALNRLVENVQMAKHLGVDLWRRATPGGATIGGAITSYFQWNYLQRPFPWSSCPDYQGAWRQNSFERAAENGVASPAVLEWLNGARPVDGRESNLHASLVCARATLQSTLGKEDSH